MSYNIQHQLEIRNFESVKNFLSSLDREQFVKQFTIMYQTYQMVKCEDQIPDTTKCEILDGIDIITKEFTVDGLGMEYQASTVNANVLTQQDYDKSVAECEMVEHMMRDKYLANTMTLQDYCMILIALGDLDRNLNMLKKHIEDIH